MWFAAPGAAHAVGLALAAFAVATVAAEVAAVFNNAMMPHLVPPERLGRLSGTGWAVGYVGGLASLVLVLGFLAASPETGKTYLGLNPLFGLDPARREGDRIVGPFAAVWFLVFVAPLFLFTPDLPRSGRRTADAVRAGLARLRSTIAEARRDASLTRFLVANMVYQDGLVALFAFGGIYGAGVFGWGTLELGVFGILLTVTGTLGALIGGALDDRLGARPVILGALAVLVLVCLGILSLGRDHVLFVVPTAPPQPGGLYGSAPKRFSSRSASPSAQWRVRCKPRPAACSPASCRRAKRAAISACSPSRAKSHRSWRRSWSRSRRRSPARRRRGRRC